MTVSTPALAILGAAPAFAETLHVGRPNIGDRHRFLAMTDEILDRRWLTNSGPMVEEFERRIAQRLGVAECVAMANATVALELLYLAVGLSGEVIVPSFTFVATVHALQRAGITPVFCDIDPNTHCLDTEAVEALVTPRTTGIVGVHLWGRMCDVEALERVARRHNLALVMDAAHAFDCATSGRVAGGGGLAEVFSFHATKVLNTFEGGAVTTNDGDLARRLRLSRNFGFAGYDEVVCLGTNGKMPEVSAAMGLVNLDELDTFIAANRRNYLGYQSALSGLPGVHLHPCGELQRSNYQYVVLEVDPEMAALTREELRAVLLAENVLVRRYFWPGVHRMEPYRTLYPQASARLPHTERVASRVLVLPTGTQVGLEAVDTIGRLIRTALANAAETRSAVRARLA